MPRTSIKEEMKRCKKALVESLAIGSRMPVEELTPRQLKQLEKQERRKKYADLAIQGTNNSSIASKRSVELLYLPKLSEAAGSGKPPREYFKYFVRKSPKRSPCINRGYWLRLHAIRSRLDSIVEGTHDDIVVVNLGCGFDPLPFQILDQHNPASEKYKGRVRFVDVDYSDLISEKVRIIQETAELAEILGPRSLEQERVAYGTDCYIAVSCNLNYPKSFRDMLDAFRLNNPKTIKVFIAEVSLAYMSPGHADDIIATCGGMPNSHFLLLEQLTPAGPSEPFAKQMLKHFKKNNSPLLSVQKYFTTEAQKNRFIRLGFPRVNAGNMFKLWQCVNPAERLKVQSVEAFDELEEFHLFCHHYLICHATNENSFVFEDLYRFGPSAPAAEIDVKQDAQFEVLNHSISRKFGASAALVPYERDFVLYFGGSSPGRLNQLLGIDVKTGAVVNLECTNSPRARMCHTLTSLGDSKRLLLVGGRQSPHDGYEDSWFLDTSSRIWSEGPKLPEARYRHCAALVDDQVIICGGVTTGAPFLRYDANANAFQPCTAEGLDVDCPLSSAAMDYSSDAQLGIIVGGSTDEVNVSDALHVFAYRNNKILIQKTIRHPLLQRYGAKVNFINDHEILVVGGTSPEMLFGEDTSVIIVDLHTEKITGVRLHREVWQDQPLFLVGCELIAASAAEYIVIGGGATCYGFGSVYNNGFKIRLSMG
ncbi:hypothetical protein HG536_0E00350 [Torulaspora globosa]|uniref:tRNA wybutosine-synthesizing protein 4 n=1 Tax=Torulaspora globosa TaxID=48254 RepID=A0A7G3ZHY9_9SACH|nr:uncharacterized protein HG536_0E00350 [Torulaspora globosa]QLL33125.1 hypothetical protein HG536_0E00350 [Torulaspora globosa]